MMLDESPDTVDEEMPIPFSLFYYNKTSKAYLSSLYEWPSKDLRDLMMRFDHEGIVVSISWPRISSGKEETKGVLFRITVLC